MSRLFLCALVLVVPILAMPSCTESMGERVFIGSDCQSGFCDGGEATGFAPSGPDGGVSPDATTPLAASCPTNECPSGRTTCPNNPFPCAVDPSSDDNNCGACGTHCPSVVEALGLVSECIAGACRFACAPGRADCNGIMDDGCEIVISGEDKNNCGGCGVVCSTICIQGNCGCGAGSTFCDSACKKLATDPMNCGACGNACDTSPPPLPAEWHAKSFSCVGGKCNQPICWDGWMDCDGDFGNPSGNGCERNIDEDPNNCGGCGIACAPGEVCSSRQCVCTCGAGCNFPVNSDIDNCGACSFECPGARSRLPVLGEPWMDISHGGPICEQGSCGYRCTPQWGDCDHDVENGCETRLTDDPRNCGSCGIRCDAVEGQACVDGHCTMKECEVR